MCLKKIVNINISLLIFFAIGYLLSTINFPYVQFIAGMFLFFLPGLNLTWVMELLVKQKIGPEKLTLWTISTSPIIVSFFVFISILLNKSQFNENFILLSLLFLTSLTFALVVCVKIITKEESTTIDLKKIQDEKIFWMIFSFVLIFLGINFILYKFIPEVDGYVQLINMADFIKQGEIPNDLLRPLFTSFSLTISFATRIPLYWIFKIIIPLLASSIFLPFYFIAKQKFSSKTQLALLSLLPFSIPVVSLEVLYARPQSLFILAFVIFCYLAVEILKIKNEFARPYFLTILLLLSLVGLKIHEFFFFLVIIISFSLLLSLLPLIKKYPKKTLLFGSLFLISISGWIKDFGIFAQAKSSIDLFLTYLLHPKFSLWFISNYTNIDGNSMGWPGLSWILYYGYNLGLVLPLILLYAFFKKSKGFKIDKKTALIIGMAFILFFSIAEIFPRLGLAYYPDRAWLFVSISLALAIVISLPSTNLNKIPLAIFTTILILSILTSFALTYLKQGWTTTNEYSASQFIKNNLPADAVILSQVGNTPMINYFSGRICVIPPKEFFFNANNEQIKKYLADLPITLSRDAEFQKKKQDILSTIYEQLDMLKSNSIENNNFPTKAIDRMIINYDQINILTNNIKKKGLNKTHPLYILYSKDKFTGLYGGRKWWQDGNYYNAPIEKFDSNNYFKNIYNNNSIYIWLVK